MSDITHNSMFTELTTYLSPDQLELVKPYLLYVDNAVIEEFASIYGGSDETIALGLITSAPNEDMLMKFIDYLMK